MGKDDAREAGGAGVCESGYWQAGEGRRGFWRWNDDAAGQWGMWMQGGTCAFECGRVVCGCGVWAALAPDVGGPSRSLGHGPSKSLEASARGECERQGVEGQRDLVVCA